MSGIINRNNPIAEENIDPDGRPAIDKFEDWSNEVSETENAFHDTKENITKSKKERIKEMDKVIKEDLK
ncbi:hypothetical protein HCG69_05165 [Bacteroides sp. K03]|uniref:hypothetical protein n=1 Tax=Bacteroides TaxID=816 RepID=UPI001C8B2852|nr:MULTISPECIES: hypothetical protein [Bacteroides]MBX9187478.1 hypothetical protein [Bacteroides sp. K03]